YALATLIVVAVILAKLRARKARQVYGFAVEDGELVFLKLFLAAQLIFLFVIVTNKFHGIPLSAIILGVIAFAVYVLTTHTPFGRYLYAIGGNEEAAVISGIPVENVVVASSSIMRA